MDVTAATETATPGGTPLVSVLIPAFNAAAWIAEAIDSACAQSYEHLEILVGDNASTDETLAIARSSADPRLRVLEWPHNVGLVANHNLLAQASRGRYLKFLHADDVLYPDCVQRMVELASRDMSIGLVFTPRDVIATGPGAAAWIDEFGRPHEHFTALGPVNEGRVLLWELLDAGFDNWIGEPSATLVTRDALRDVGLFNPRLRQISDLELWLRIALRYRLGFIDRALSAYRHHELSASAASAATGDDWLDPLWLAESLLVANGTGSEQRRLRAHRNRRLLQALKNQSLGLAQGQLQGGLHAYCRYRLRNGRTRGSERSTMHPALA